MLSRHWRLWLSFPSPGPLPKSGWGSSWLFLLASLPLRLVRPSLKSVKVTAADRAAAPCLHLANRECGGGGFSERSPSPGPPSEERLGLKLALPSY